MKNPVVLSLIITAILFESFTLVTFAQDSQSDSEAIITVRNNSETIQRIVKQDPAQFSPIIINAVENWKFASEQKAYNIRMDIDPIKNAVVFEKNKVTMTVWVPKSKNISTMQTIKWQIISANNNFDVVIQSIDGGMRYVLNIHSNKADKYYDFPMELPTGYILTQDPSGAVLIKDISGKIYTSIWKPWAKDANGNEIKTWYTIKDSTLRQYVDFDKNTVFPIVADPIWCGQTISSTYWIYRGWTHPWSLSVVPTECWAWGVTLYSREWYWQDLLAKTPVSTYWSQTSTTQNGSMLDQLMCHAYFPGGAKTPWNLEPTRPNVWYWATVLAACNPN